MPKILEDRVKKIKAKGVPSSEAWGIATKQLKKAGKLSKGGKVVKKGKH